MTKEEIKKLMSQCYHIGVWCGRNFEPTDFESDCASKNLELDYIFKEKPVQSDEA